MGMLSVAKHGQIPIDTEHNLDGTIRTSCRHTSLSGPAGDAMGSLSDLIVSAAGSVQTTSRRSCENHLELLRSEVEPLISSSPGIGAVTRRNPSQSCVQASSIIVSTHGISSCSLNFHMEHGGSYGGPLLLFPCTAQDKCRCNNDAPILLGEEGGCENACRLQQPYLCSSPFRKVKTWRLSGSLADCSAFSIALPARRHSSAVQIFRRYSCGYIGGRDNWHVHEVLVHGSMAFTAHKDHKIRVWKLSNTSKPSYQSHKLLQTLPTAEDWFCNCFCQQNYVNTRRHHRCLWIQHVDTISALAVGVVEHQGMDQSDEYSFLNNGKHALLYSASWDKTFKVWSLLHFKCMESVIAHHDAVNALVVGRCFKSHMVDGPAITRQLIYTGSSDGTVKVWARDDTTCMSAKGVCKKKRTKHSLVATLPDHKCPVNALAVSKDGNAIFSAGGDGRIRVWRIRTSVSYFTQGVSEVSQSKDDHGDGAMVDVDEDVQAPVEVTLCSILEGHKGAILCLCMSGDLLLSGSADKTVRAWCCTVLLKSCSRSSKIIKRPKPQHGLAQEDLQSPGIMDISKRCLMAIMQGHKAPIKSVFVLPCLDDHHVINEESHVPGYIVYTGALDMAIKVWWLNPNAKYETP